MIRLWIMLVLCLSAGLCAAQKVPVRIVIKDACVDSLIVLRHPKGMFAPETGWGGISENIPDASKEYGFSSIRAPDPDKNGTVWLEKGKQYLFGGTYLRKGSFAYEIYFRFTVNTPFDTIVNIPRIAKFTTGMSGYRQFLDCNKLCKGYCADYYENGTMRMEGTFSKGRPNGDLKFYDPNGILRKYEKYRSGKNVKMDDGRSDLKLFYENGGLRKHLKFGKDDSLLSEIFLYDKDGTLLYHEVRSQNPDEWKYKFEEEDW